MSTSSAEQQLALQLAQQQQASSNPLFDSLYGMGGAGSMQSSQQVSGLQQSGLKQGQQQMGLGIGSSGSGGSNQMQMQALLRQQNLLSGCGLSDSALPGMQQRRLNQQQQQQQALGNNQQQTLDEQEEMCHARLQKLRQDIFDRQRRAGVGVGEFNGNQRFDPQDSDD